MITFIRSKATSLKDKWTWQRTIRGTHQQRRYDQLVMLIYGATTLDAIYAAGELADEFEAKFAGEPFHDRFVRALASRISTRSKWLYRRMIYAN
jgi:hypothetical protein